MFDLTMENNGYAFAKMQAKRENATRRERMQRKIDAGDGFPFKCNKCPKQYSNSGTLHNHKATVHFDLRKFKCDLCGKAYKLKMQLKSTKCRILRRLSNAIYVRSCLDWRNS